MGLIISDLHPILDKYSMVIIVVLSAICFSCAYIVLSRVGSVLFAIYQGKFYKQVDQGLKDVLVLLDPKQVFSITVSIAVILGPLIYLIGNLVAALISVALILLAPPVVLKVMKVRRSEKFVKQLPDALASMSSALRSGLNLVKTLQQIVKNQPQPLCQEFAQVLVEYRIGTDLNDSFSDLAKRIDRPEVVLMNSAIKINRAVGGNLAETFDNLANTLRETTKVEGRIKALTAMGVSQGRLAAFFPVLMGYVLYKMEPQAMGLLFTTPLGWIWLGAMAFMALMGVFLINKIVKIDV